MIWSSPTYHGPVSGAFKNAPDWLVPLADADPPYLTNKPVGLVVPAGGVHGLQAVNIMDFLVRALRGWAVPLVMPVDHGERSIRPVGSSTSRPQNSCAVLAKSSYARRGSSARSVRLTTPTSASSLQQA
ncbi:MAG: NADPH-dependent FMN reductase [Mycobacteriaceae bacterium]